MLVKVVAEVNTGAHSTDYDDAVMIVFENRSAPMLRRSRSPPPVRTSTRLERQHEASVYPTDCFGLSGLEKRCNDATPGMLKLSEPTMRRPLLEQRQDIP
jgi:hypothetical protein